MDFSNYKFRCSSLGDIWSESGKITQGNITFLKKLYYQETRKYKEEIVSKYFEKGIICEEDGIQLLNDTLFKGCVLLKNKERRENDYFIGECDLSYKKWVVDIKNNWDWVTFSNAELTREYECQGYGYMDLWSVDNFILFYCLINMPEHMLNSELNKIFFAGKYLSREDSEYLSKADNIIRRYCRFEEYEPYERFKAFFIEKNKKMMERIKQKVVDCRIWLNEYHQSVLNNRIKNQELILNFKL